MNATYPTTYCDARGEEATVIHNDGCTLGVHIRGVAFAGESFDALSPRQALSDADRQLFTLQHDCLCACTLRCTMSLDVIDQTRQLNGELSVEVVLGEPTANGGLSHERVRLTLRSSLGELVSAGQSGWFEDELLDLNGQLGATAHIMACITCAFSDYSPYGHGIFGDMACFRSCKDRYERVQTKIALFELWPLLTEFVQETYVCSEYRLRMPGRGYRG
mgnify:CR=1 FL=1